MRCGKRSGFNKEVTPILPMMETFLDEEKLLAYASERYSMIATNAEDTELSIQEVVWLYRQRGVVFGY